MSPIIPPGSTKTFIAIIFIMTLFAASVASFYYIKLPAHSLLAIVTVALLCLMYGKGVVIMNDYEIGLFILSSLSVSLALYTLVKGDVPAPVWITSGGLWISSYFVGLCSRPMRHAEEEIS